VKRKPDYSRLVMVDITPSEAVVLGGVLEGFMLTRGDALHSNERAMIEDIIARLRFQLHHLNWPLDQAKKAPYPV
jgi:hypothetical protein